jgi:uncharacterized membrane protein
MFAFGGMRAAPRFILVARRFAHTRICHELPRRAATQWHASRSVCLRAKGIDLAMLIVYNLSNWTGLNERGAH